MERAEYRLKWTPDCQGKWDYDSDLVWLSSRYWPRGGGFHMITPDGKWEGNEARPEICPSAASSIHIGAHDGENIELITANFEGDTEAEVKAQVETWAKAMIARVEAAVCREFALPNTAST